ncbi:MAG: hypothetical protein R2798_11085 [Chitinophagales bacterium]|nr:hypothetical protein [Bacteroidota bacterium]MCB9043250.1 hypothetical protein [Chitinophagales bacterium]
MKYFFTFLFCIGFVGLQAQDCKFETNELDKFTQEKILKSKPAVLWAHKVNGNNFSVYAHFEGGREWLEFKYLHPESFSFKEGANVIFLFDDSSTLQLPIDKAASSEKTPEMARYTAYFNCTLNSDAFAALSSKTITDIRIPATEGAIDRAIAEANRKKLAEVLHCLRQEEK